MGRHRQSYVEARGDLPLTVGFVRMINDIPPRIPRQNAGKHRPECGDDTIVFGLIWREPEPVRPVGRRWFLTVTNPLRCHPRARLS